MVPKEGEKRILEEWGENLSYKEVSTRQPLRFGVERFPLSKRHVEVGAMGAHFSYGQLLCPLHRYPGHNGCAGPVSPLPVASSDKRFSVFAFSDLQHKKHAHLNRYSMLDTQSTTP